MTGRRYIPKVRRDSISWWAEVYDSYGDRIWEEPCFTEWGAKRVARRGARRVAKLEREGWLAKGSYEV